MLVMLFHTFIVALACFVTLVLPNFYVPGRDDKLLMQSANSIVYPWIGILKLKTFNRASYSIQEAVTGIILIKKQVAICNAQDVHSIKKETIRTTSTVIFYNGIKYKKSDPDVQEWESYVSDYQVHPEFYLNATSNTIAVLFLRVKSIVPDYFWQPIKWPIDDYRIKAHVPLRAQQYFAVGYTDRNKILEQVAYKMIPVKKEECIAFYKKEGLDFSTLWPTHYNCFKERGQASTCLYDSGMAIASKATRRWTLIGMSTYGPGCSLPSRFIAFYPYIPWLQTLPKLQEDKIQYTRRQGSDFNNDTDTAMYQIFNATSPKINEYSGEFLFEVAYPNWEYKNPKPDFVDQKCKTLSKTFYAEEGVFTAEKLPEQTVFYSVTLYERQLYRLTCLRVITNCQYRSKIQMSFGSGFSQDDAPSFIQKATAKPPFSGFRDKILYLQDGYYQYHKKRTVTVWFKFTFQHTAKITVLFYWNMSYVKPDKPKTGDEEDDIDSEEFYKNYGQFGPTKPTLASPDVTTLPSSTTKKRNYQTYLRRLGTYE